VVRHGPGLPDFSVVTGGGIGCELVPRGRVVADAYDVAGETGPATAATAAVWR
jgi:hypothetical protein